MALGPFAFRDVEEVAGRGPVLTVMLPCLSLSSSEIDFTQRGILQLGNSEVEHQQCALRAWPHPSATQTTQFIRVRCE